MFFAIVTVDRFTSNSNIYIKKLIPATAFPLAPEKDIDEKEPFFCFDFPGLCFHRTACAVALNGRLCQL
jgi:hypothetical protein